MGKEYQNNGKQSKATRLELLIALKYLLDECPDEHHASKTIALTDYALKNFSVNLDRRRVNDIFIDLMGFTKEHPDVLPYSVKKVDKKPRYYLEKHIFTDKAIKAISTSLIRDFSLTKQTSDRLLEIFLDTVCNKEDKEKLLAQLERKKSVEKHISVASKNRILFFEDLKLKTKRFYFKLDKAPGKKDVASGRSYLKVIESNKIDDYRQKYVAGIVHEIFAEGDDTDLCIYLPDYKDAIIINIENIVLKEDFEPVAQWSTPSFDLSQSKYEDIYEWLAAYYQGKTGFVEPIEFKFYVGDKNKQLKILKKKYEEFFKTPMVYTLVDREVKIPQEDGSEVSVIAKDAVTRVECNYSAFRKWFWESGAFECVVVLHPAIYNNLLLSKYVKRFQRRIDIYGYKPTDDKKDD